jgi:hypothetical protein
MTTTRFDGRMAKFGPSGMWLVSRDNTVTARVFDLATSERQLSPGAMRRKLASFLQPSGPIQHHRERLRRLGFYGDRHQKAL